MATRPSTLPIWATSGAIVVPSGSKQDLGWVVEKPPHQSFNWWQNLVFQWLEFFSEGQSSEAKQFFMGQL